MKTEVEQLRARPMVQQDFGDDIGEETSTTPTMTPPVISPPKMGAPPPPPPMGGAPPPPPPPPPPGSGSTKLKINRTNQTQKLQEVQEERQVQSQPSPQNDLIEMLKKGVKLRKTEGPVPQDKKLEEMKKPNDIFSIGNIVSDVAKSRAKRMVKKKDETSYRKSVVVDNLLNEMDKKTN